MNDFMPYDERVAELFQPMRLRSLTMRNQFAMAPMTRRASPGGIPGADVAEYTRAAPQAAPA